MAKLKYSDVEDAFMYISSMPDGENSAYLRTDIGKILFRSEMAGIDELEDEEDLDWDKCVEMPHKNDLDLGRDLVFEFVERQLPDDYYNVRQMFNRRGAYSKYKALLERRGLLQKWYEFENSREEKALRKWCRLNEVELED